MTHVNASRQDEAMPPRSRPLISTFGILAAVAAVLAAAGSASAASELPAPAGKIAFSRAVPGSPSDIWIMNADGSNLRQATCGTRFDLAPAWSNNGQQLAFFSPVTLTTQSLYVIDARRLAEPCLNREGALLTGGRFVSWSRDGRIAFDRGGAGRRDIWVTDRDGAETDLTGDPGAPQLDPTRETRADWSPDGKRLVFAKGPAEEENNEDIYVINADGSGVIQLTCDLASNPPCNHAPAGENGPQWSPDGQTIVFESDRDDTNCVRGRNAPQCMNKLYTMNPDGSEQRRLLGPVDPMVQPIPPENHAGAEGTPKWSPNGQQIVFSGDNLDASSDTNQLFIVNADGSELRQLTDPLGVSNTFPDWGSGPVLPVVP